MYRPTPTLKEVWKAAIALRDTPLIHAESARLAFMAGADAMLSIIELLADSGLSQREGIAAITEYKQEIQMHIDRAKESEHLKSIAKQVTT